MKSVMPIGRNTVRRKPLFAAILGVVAFCAILGVGWSGAAQESGGWAGERRPPRRDPRNRRWPPVPRSDSRQSPRTQTDVPPTEPIHAGFVILHDQYVPPPYVLEWQEGSLTVNGETVDWRMPARFGPRWGGRGGGIPARRLHRVEQHLRDDGLLLALPEERAALVPAYEGAELLKILLDDTAKRQERVQKLMSLHTVRTTSGHWGRLLDEFEPGPELAGRVEALREQIESMRRTGSPGGRGLGRTRIVSLLSVVLSALAIGILLSHIPHHEQGWTGIDDSKKGKRRVLWLVGLLVVLNVFDLVCTILAAEAGGFLELNPLVERHLGSPGAVIAFKSVLVLGGATVLILCRRHRIVQVAAWGAALVYTVVTLRWAMMGSMFVF